MDIIDYNKMVKVIVDDLINHYDYSELKAKEFADKYTDSIIDNMWNTYTELIESEANNLYNRINHE